MKKIILFSAFTFLIITGCIFRDSDYLSESPKGEALKEWDSIYKQADFHRGALKDMKTIIKKSAVNIPVLMEITGLIATVPYHTLPLLHIAERASHAKNESIDFYLLAELALLKLGETDKVNELADYAASLGAEDDLSEYEKRYSQLRSTIDAETIEEATEMVKEMIEKAKSSASSL